MTDTLTIVHNTWLTLSQSQPTDLPGEQKHSVLTGASFPVLSYERTADFIQFTLNRDRLSDPNPFGDNLTWYVVAADAKIVRGSSLQFASFFSGLSGIIGRILPRRGDDDTTPN